MHLFLPECSKCHWVPVYLPNRMDRKRLWCQHKWPSTDADRATGSRWVLPATTTTACFRLGIVSFFDPLAWVVIHINFKFVSVVSTRYNVMHMVASFCRDPVECFRRCSGCFWHCSDYFDCCFASGGHTPHQIQEKDISRNIMTSSCEYQWVIISFLDTVDQSLLHSRNYW